MLSFQVIESGNAIQVCCDSAGMATLLEKLASLLRQSASHIHLRGPSAGGNDLSETSPEGERAVWEVVIDYNPSD